jgi:hypothetical protein
MRNEECESGIINEERRSVGIGNNKGSLGKRNERERIKNEESESRNIE